MTRASNGNLICETNCPPPPPPSLSRLGSTRLGSWSRAVRYHVPSSHLLLMDLVDQKIFNSMENCSFGNHHLLAVLCYYTQMHLESQKFETIFLRPPKVGAYIDNAIDACDKWGYKHCQIYQFFAESVIKRQVQACFKKGVHVSLIIIDRLLFNRLLIILAQKFIH